MNDLTIHPPANIPEHLRAIEGEINALDQDAVPGEAVRLYHTFERSGWAAAFALLRVQEEQIHPGLSFTAWVKDQGLNQSNVSRLTGAARTVLDMPEEYREAAQLTSPGVLYDAGIQKLVKSDPVEAGKLASKGLTRSKLVGEVRARLPEDQHISKSPMRTFSVSLRAEQFDRLLGLMRYMRLLMVEGHPSPAQVMDALEAEAEDLIAEFWGRQKLAGRFNLEDVLRGRVFCIETGATNGENLHSHHVIPRGMVWQDREGRSYRGEDGPQVWLSSETHERVHHDYEGGGNWREWAGRWLGRKDLDWLKAQVEEFIAPHTLETFGR